MAEAAAAATGSEVPSTGVTSTPPAPSSSLPELTPPPKSVRYSSEGGIEVPDPGLTFCTRVLEFSDEDFQNLPKPIQEKLVTFSNSKVLPLLRESQSVAAKQVEFSSALEKFEKDRAEKEELESYLKKFLSDRKLNLSEGDLRGLIGRLVNLTCDIEGRLGQMMENERKRGFEEAFAHTYSSSSQPSQGIPKKVHLSDAGTSQQQQQLSRKPPVSQNTLHEFDYQGSLTSRHSGPYGKPLSSGEIDQLAEFMLHRMNEPPRIPVHYSSKVDHKQYELTRINFAQQHQH